MDKGTYVLTEADKQWNKMWDLWVAGSIESPYTELMTYDSEVNNGGHDQYFDYIESFRDPEEEIAALETILSEKLKQNLQRAYKIHLSRDQTNSQNASTTPCDLVFYDNEDEVIQTLQAYASKIKL